MIVLIVGLLLVISFFWALYALRKETRADKNVTHVQSELQKEKILFRKDSD